MPAVKIHHRICSDTPAHCGDSRDMCISDTVSSSACGYMSCGCVFARVLRLGGDVAPQKCCLLGICAHLLAPITLAHLAFATRAPMQINTKLGRTQQKFADSPFRVDSPHICRTHPDLGRNHLCVGRCPCRICSACRHAYLELARPTRPHRTWPALGQCGITGVLDWPSFGLEQTNVDPARPDLSMARPHVGLDRPTL